STRSCAAETPRAPPSRTPAFPPVRQSTASIFCPSALPALCEPQPASALFPSCPWSLSRCLSPVADFAVGKLAGRPDVVVLEQERAQLFLTGEFLIGSWKHFEHALGRIRGLRSGD